MGIRLADDRWQLLSYAAIVLFLGTLAVPAAFDVATFLGYLPQWGRFGDRFALLGPTAWGAIAGLIGVATWKSRTAEDPTPVYLGSPPADPERSSVKEEGFLEPDPTDRGTGPRNRSRESTGLEGPSPQNRPERSPPASRRRDDSSDAERDPTLESN